jgi:hypothetical protein
VLEESKDSIDFLHNTEYFAPSKFDKRHWELRSLGAPAHAGCPYRCRVGVSAIASRPVGCERERPSPQSLSDPFQRREPHLEGT